jgi:ribosomal protein S18 acetylase RimI-like enzyme
MAKSNLERMIKLAEEVFDNRNDPNQLDVNDEVRKQLLELHPSTLSEYDDGNGPVAWILIIPTTIDLMNQFLDNKINEKQLLSLTPKNHPYDAIYLCSALVLPEYRRKGIAKRLTTEAIENIQKTNSIKALFVWPFSKEGDIGAESIAKATGIKLWKKKEG